MGNETSNLPCQLAVDSGLDGFYLVPQLVALCYPEGASLGARMARWVTSRFLVWLNVWPVRSQVNRMPARYAAAATALPASLREMTWAAK